MQISFCFCLISFYSNRQRQHLMSASIQSPDTAKWRLAMFALITCANATDSSPNASATIPARPRRLPVRLTHSGALANVICWANRLLLCWAKKKNLLKSHHPNNNISFPPLFIPVWLSALCAVWMYGFFSRWRLFSYFYTPLLKW